MKKRISVIISSLSMIAISIILLLVFFLSENKNEKLLYCSASDIELKVGETIYNYYDITKANAEISFSVNKENIIEIDKTKIYGQCAGEVEVTLTATLGEEKSVATFHVKVYDESYRVEFSSIVDCSLEGNTLYAQSKISQFKFEVFDQLGNKLSNLKFEVTVEGDASATKNFSNIMLTLNENSKLIFKFTDLDFEITLNAVLAEG